jgi:hypothetical protein
VNVLFRAPPNFSVGFRSSGSLLPLPSKRVSGSGGAQPTPSGACVLHEGVRVNDGAPGLWRMKNRVPQVFVSHPPFLGLVSLRSVGIVMETNYNPICGLLPSTATSGQFLP